MNKLIRGFMALLNLVNPKHWGPFAEISHLTRFDHAASVSWSQGGEDLALLHIFPNQNWGSYIDVGAHHPDRFSVTRHLYQRGWTGINVEANPYLLPIFDKKRPLDLNLNFAVGTEKIYELSIFSETAISTVSSVWKEKFLSEQNTLSKSVQVSGITLRTLLDAYFAEGVLDLLAVDAEGSDLNVIQSLDFRTLEISRFPKWLLLESTPPVVDALKTDSVSLAMSFGYTPYLVLPMSVILKSPNFS
jgi:FkbM family methyltransferase